jgi:hypothetical protein
MPTCLDLAMIRNPVLAADPVFNARLGGRAPESGLLETRLSRSWEEGTWHAS